MIKLDLTYSDIVPLTDEIRENENFDENDVLKSGDKDYYYIDVEQSVLLEQNAKTLLLYKSRTGREWQSDFEKAFDKLGGLLKGLTSSDTDNLTMEEQLSLVPMITDDTISVFLKNAVSCMYKKLNEDMSFTQNEATADEAYNSLWIEEAASMEHFQDILAEVSKMMKMKGNSSKKGISIRR